MRHAVALFALTTVAALGLFAFSPRADASVGSAVVEMAPLVVSAAPYEPEHAWNDVINCVPLALFANDAGTGYPMGTIVPSLKLDGGVRSGFVVGSIESESTTPTYQCWKDGTTRANAVSVCRKRCVGCNNGTGYAEQIRFALGELKCFVEADAGVNVRGEFAQ